MSETPIVIYRPGQLPEQMDVPHPYGIREITSLVKRLLGNAEVEHVPVVYKGAWRMLLVDPAAQIRAKPRNETATAIYRNYLVSAFPNQDPEDSPAIWGDAVLFLSSSVTP